MLDQMIEALLDALEVEAVSGDERATAYFEAIADAVDEVRRQGWGDMIAFGEMRGAHTNDEWQAVIEERADWSTPQP